MGLRRLPAVLLWPGLPLLYLLAPGHALGMLPGLPLSWPGLGLGLVVGLGAWCGARPVGRRLRVAGLALAAAIGLKLLLGAVALPYGLAAEYRVGDHNAPIERSTEWRVGGATRVDRSLEFVGDEFPVHFFNDLRRFNSFRPSEPRRDLLPFAVTWRGWLVAPSEGERCLRLSANGSATLRVGALAPVTVERATRVEQREACGSLAVGAQPIEVRFSRPQDGVPYLRVVELGPDRSEMSIEPGRLLRAPVDVAGWERDRWMVGRLALGLDLLVVLAIIGAQASCLLSHVAAAIGRGGQGRQGRQDRQDRQDPARCDGGGLAPAARLPPDNGGYLGTPRYRGAGGLAVRNRPLQRERFLLSLAILAAFAEALISQRHFAGRTPILSGGNDWLAYASFARDVLLNGPLINGGRPLGQGETFYYQPLYSYFLATVHLLIGESLWGVLVTQYVLMALSGVLTFYLAKELFSVAAAWAAFALFWVLRYLVFNATTELLLSENLVCIFIPPMLLLLARWQHSWRRSDLIGGALLLGLAILTRSTPLLFLPPAMLLVALAQLRKFGHRRAALGAAGLLFVVAMAVASLVAVRNYVVAGKPALLPESTSANLWEVHRPSAKVDLRQIERDPLYNRLNLDRQTREVIEFARQDPAGYGWTLAQMGLYALGFTGPALGTSQVQYELVALTALYLAAVLLVPEARRLPAWLVHAFVATHFFQMMIFMSHQYGFRLPLPMYAPMMAVAGVAVAAGLGRLADALTPALSPWERAGVRGALATAVVVLAGLWALRMVALPRAPEGPVFGIGGDAGPAARAVRESADAWQADRLYFTGLDQRSLGVAYLPGLAYRDMKWIDTSQALAWPSEGRRGMLVVRGDQPTRLMAECWGPAALDAQLRDIASADRVLIWLPSPAERRCAVGERRKASFGGLLDVTVARIVDHVGGGPSDLLVAWRVRQPPSFKAQLVAERLDSAGVVSAERTADAYPSARWEPGELIVTRLPLPDGDTGQSRLAVGFTRGTGGERMAIDDPLALYGQVRVAVDE